jgi:uncharacterized membrane protein
MPWKYGFIVKHKDVRESIMIQHLSEGGGKRLGYLDSVRGLAALSVVWSHFVLG